MPNPPSSAPKNYESYQVAVICAMSFEMSAVRFMLDREHPRLRPAQGDSNLYVLGDLNGHDVALACLPGTQGKGAAATVATNFARTFPAIKWFFLVGIGGGVPSAKHDIRLGDVVVSMPEGQYGGVVQYDLGKDTDDGFQLKGFLWPPPTILRNATELMRSDHLVGDNKVEAHLSQMLQDRPGLSHYERPPPGHDILFEEGYSHVTDSNDCKECDMAGIKSRPPRQPEGPRVHYGLIASGDRVIKSVAKRIAATGNVGDVLCFEMEAAGIATEFPCLVIRGVSDYADSHKNDRWQPYAAAVAAATVKELLSYITPEPLLVEGARGSSSGQCAPLGRDEPVIQEMSGLGIQNTGAFSVGGNVNIGVPLDQTQEAITKKCLSALCRTDPRDYRRRLEQIKGGLLEASYRWIFENQSFRKWREDHETRLLWIKGDPGKGKTMLLCGIIRELERSTASTSILSYFFCQGTDLHINNATAVLRGLIYRLIKQQISLVSHMQERYDSDGKPLFGEEDALVILSEILSNILHDQGVKEAYLIIDGLDECETDLPQLLQLISQYSSSLRCVKWIVSSRDRPQIDRQLKLHSSGLKINLELAENAVEVSHAVDAYIDARVAELELLQDGLKVQIRDALRQKANGTFLWVALVFKELQNVNNWDMLRVIEELPMDLEKLYDRMISQIQQLKRSDPEYCRLTLSAAALAMRPLCLPELGVLSGLPQVITGNVEYIRRIVALCGSFLTIQNDYVYLIHQSAQDYLVGKDSGKPKGRVFPSGTVHVHHGIFSRSVQAMKSLLKRDIYDLDDPGLSPDEIKTPDPDPLATIRYSCVYWLYHFRIVYASGECVNECIRDLSDDGSILEFFSEYFLYWLESLCLLGKPSYGILLVRTFLHFVRSQSHVSHCLTELLEDAEVFVLRHMPMIEQAPLQAYGSALLFSPMTSKVRSSYWEKDRLPFIKSVLGIGDSWGAHRVTIEHGERVDALVLSSDGGTIASVTNNGRVRIWDAGIGRLRQKLEIEASSTPHDVAVALSPKGKTLISASDKGVIHLWDTAIGTCQQTHEGDLGSYPMRVFIPDGKKLILASDEGDISLRDTATGALLQRLKGSGSPITALACSPKAKTIVSSDKRAIYIWDTTDGDLDMMFVRNNSENTTKALAWSHKGKMLAATSHASASVFLWDTTDPHRQPLNMLCTSPITFSPNNKILASTLTRGRIALYDATTGVHLQTLHGHRWSVTDMAFSSSGKTLVSAASNGTIIYWDMPSVLSGKAVNIWGKEERERTCQMIWDDDLITTTTFSPDGKLIASASSVARIWDAATGKLQRTFRDPERGPGVQFVSFSPDGGKLVSGSYGDVRLWDVATGILQQKFRHKGVRFVVFSPDGGTLVSGSIDDVRLWDAATATFRRTLDQSERCWPANILEKSATFSPNGKIIALNTLAGDIRLWDMATGTLLQKLEQRTPGIAIDFSPDSRTLASATLFAISGVWDVATGSWLEKIPEEHSEWFRTLAFGRDGKYPEFGPQVFNIDSESGGLEASIGKKTGGRLCFRGEWIVKDRKKILWLPPHYRPIANVVGGIPVALKDGKVVLKNTLAGVILLCFDLSTSIE